MDYFDTQKGQFDEADIRNVIDIAFQNELFVKLIDFSDLDKVKLTNLLTDLENVIACIMRLVSARKCDYFSGSHDKSSNMLDRFEFSSSEKKFIKKHSIIYRYFPNLFKDEYVDRIVFDGRIEYYFVSCFLLGILSSGESYKNNYNFSNINQKKIYTDLINSFYGGIYIPKDARKIIKPLVEYFREALLLKDSGKKFNFIEKGALFTHGFEYVQLGSTLSAYVDHKIN